MRLIWIVLYLLLILLGISFSALNSAAVQVNFYITVLTMPLSVLMIITLGLGIFLGFLLFICRYWQLKVNCLKIKNQLKITEKEIKNLRDIPLKDQH